MRIIILLLSLIIICTLLPWQGTISNLCIRGNSEIGAPCVKDGQDGTIDDNCEFN